MGGPVRRFRQRRPDHVRPVHLLGRIEMAADVGADPACCPTPTRDRAPSTAAPGWSASSRCAAGQLDRANLHHAGATTITSCAARCTAASQAPDPDDAEIVLRTQAGVSEAGEFTRAPASTGCCGTMRRGSSGFEREPDDKIARRCLGQGLLRPPRSARRRRNAATSTFASSSSTPFPRGHQPGQGARTLFNGAKMIWCQEEPKNQGGWTFIEPNIEWVLRRSAKSTPARYAGQSRQRRLAGSPGAASPHKAFSNSGADQRALATRRRLQN